jgi:hypothetical protein
LPPSLSHPITTSIINKRRRKCKSIIRKELITDLPSDLKSRELLICDKNKQKNVFFSLFLRLTNII